MPCASSGHPRGGCGWAGLGLSPRKRRAWALVAPRPADTNIVVSGLNYLGSKPFQLSKPARTGKINQTVSGSILDEMEGVLQRKFRFTAEEATEARRRVMELARTVKADVELDIIKDDPPDNRTLKCAVSAGSDYIVTGDKHQLKLTQYAGSRIVTVAEF